MSLRASQKDPELDRWFADFRRGDHAALERLVLRTTPWLRAVARRAGARGNEIDEVVQDAWVEASSKAAIPPRSVPLLIWLATIVQHRYAHLRRKEGRRARLHLVDAAVVEGASASCERNDVVAAARGREVVDLVRAALEDLDPAYRDVLYLHLFEGLAPAEVAQQLGLGRVVVRVRLFRGLRRLRSKLPDALALLLLAALSRPGRSQVPLWLSGAAAAGLAASIAFTVDFGGEAAPSGAAEIARVEVVATEPRDTGATAAVEVEGRGGDARQVVPRPALSVLVRDEHGRPLPSVGLELAPSSGRDAKLATRRAHTDERGVVEFAAVPDGDFVLRSDRGPQQAVALRSAPQHVELEVRGGSTLHGRVVDERGDAVPFATIWMATSADDTLSGTDVATADRDGAFALDGVKAGALVAARAEGRARIAAQPLDPSLPCELVLAAVGGSIEGVVVSADGEPVADALVVIGAGREGANARVAEDVDLTLPPPIVVRTDARGAFVASGLERGPVPIVVRKSGFAPQCTSLRVEPLEVVPVRIVLAEGVTLRGRVVDATTREPLAAMVACRTDDAFSATRAFCTADGRFEFASLPTGPIGLVAALWDGAATDLAFDFVNGEHDIEVAIVPRSSLSGRVIAHDGTPLAGWEITAMPSLQARDAHSGVGTARVSADGRVSVTVPSGVTAANLIVRAPSSPSWLLVTKMLETAGDGTFCVRVPRDALPSARVRARLLLADGRPVSHAKAFLTSGAGDGTAIGRTDENGVLEVGPMPPGTYRILVESPSPLLPPCELPAVTVQAFEEKEVTWQAQDLGRVDFALHFDDGTSPSAPTVYLRSVTAPLSAARLTVASGSQALAPGRYTMTAAGQDFVMFHDVPFEVRAAEVVKLERRVRTASRRLLSLRTLPESCRSGSLVGRVLDRSSKEVLGRFDIRLDARALMPLTAFLPMGQLRFEALNGDGVRVHADFELGDLEEDYVARPLQFEVER